METNDTFRKDVLSGLSSVPKKLDAKYFYDATGDRIFQQIMNCDDYYVTRCETEIFRNAAPQIADGLLAGAEALDLVELGAGDASKTIFLLEALQRKAALTYIPIDISGDMIRYLQTELPRRLPGLEVDALQGEYIAALREAGKRSERRKAVLFLGSNIGNMESEEALEFLRDVRSQLDTGDRMLVGFDLKKHPRVVSAAYDDRDGLTRAFNLNLLERINRELDGTFRTDRFEHYSTYDPLSGACRSFLVSSAGQSATVAGRAFDFREGEIIDMEISRKYDTEEIHRMAENSGFRVSDTFTDSRNWFVDVVLESV